MKLEIASANSNHLRDGTPCAPHIPEPVSALIEVPDVVAEISRVPLFTTPDEAAMLPEPESANAAPDEMVVEPV